MSHLRYDEWLDMVEIGYHCPKPSPHPTFLATGGQNYCLTPLRFTPRLSVFVPVQAIHISLTLPMSHHMDDEWFDMVEIGYHYPKPSPHPIPFESQVAKIIVACPYVSHQD
eukprot:scaffold88896_cov73-Cyclotella_meneghiniana.AAC.1